MEILIIMTITLLIFAKILIAFTIYSDAKSDALIDMDTRHHGWEAMQAGLPFAVIVLYLAIPYVPWTFKLFSIGVTFLFLRAALFNPIYAVSRNLDHTHLGDNWFDNRLKWLQKQEARKDIPVIGGIPLLTAFYVVCFAVGIFADLTQIYKL